MEIQQFDHTVQEIVQQVIDGYHPQQVILFGSIANGVVDNDSDIDLLIVKETNETPLDRRVRVRRLVNQPSRSIPFSPLVLTPEEWHYRLSLGDPFYSDILTHGKTLYVRN